MVSASSVEAGDLLDPGQLLQGFNEIKITNYGMPHSPQEWPAWQMFS
jgi:hypothetical protein